MELKKLLESLLNPEGHMDDAMRVELERRAVEIFERRREERGLTVDALARKLYPDIPIANARMAINRLRKPQITGKPKRLLYGDFIDMCLALDLVPERVIAQTITEVMESGS